MESSRLGLLLLQPVVAVSGIGDVGLALPWKAKFILCETNCKIVLYMNPDKLLQ